MPPTEVKPAPVGGVRLKVPEIVGTSAVNAPPMVTLKVEAAGLPLLRVAVTIKEIGEPQGKFGLMPMTKGVPVLLALPPAAMVP